MSIDPPPAQVRQITVHDLKRMLDENEALALYDVRTPAERDIACIAGAVLLDQEAVADIEELPRDTLLVFHCHHGIRSQSAAQYFLAKGFVNVCNVTGGIEAWSCAIDPAVRRY